LRALLSAHTLPNLICTSVDPQGWDGFKTILGDKGDHIGVIIVRYYADVMLVLIIEISSFMQLTRIILGFPDSPRC